MKLNESVKRSDQWREDDSWNVNFERKNDAKTMNQSEN